MTASQPPILVLGIETSCDETAAAVIHWRGDAGVDILSDVIWGQAEVHAPFKGVVPEIAARAHAEAVDHVIKAAMRAANASYKDLDLVAATAGPGLIGGVMVGLSAAKAVALAHDKPLVAVNHLEGHALSPRLSGAVAFPYLLLLVSGGHCQFLAVDGVGRYRRLGATKDDAAGEAFDKTARIMGLGFPGGPLIEALASSGDPRRFPLPRPLLAAPGCDFSFAGLKSAVARLWQGLAAPNEQDRSDLAAAFQAAVGDILVDRTANAIGLFGDADGRMVVAGGVAANQALRARLQSLAAKKGFNFTAPPLRYCTDNAVMIALAGAERFAQGWIDDLSAPARPRWPLDEAAAAARPSHRPGRKGAKA
ncbi:MAG: tRNA (adenosine(37)-N6)-threonylcarbamoyltransferase complex transferase subunit TsaD [Alphaproteobacteria bacterium]|nr:tRNA (adenosine(37)-N6)-threonylcarbamoyltransferase complex transferase subunit TsaD [Alphaproteobacteria bacterium]